MEVVRSGMRRLALGCRGRPSSTPTVWAAPRVAATPSTPPVGGGAGRTHRISLMVPQLRRFAETAPSTLYHEPAREEEASPEADIDKDEAATTATARKMAAEEADASVPDGDGERVRLPLPAAWRDASAWVDLELERAGLDSDVDQGALQSPWGTPDFEQPDSNVLWPHQAITEHRSRPFTLPRTAAATDDAAHRESAGGQLRQNRDRLCTLWRMSASHGISWDELDNAYVEFAQAGKHQYDRWSRPGKHGIEAVYQKEKAMNKAVALLRRFSSDPARDYPSRTKRLAARFYVKAKKQWLAPWRPGRLAAHLQQLVAARMLRRETEERALGLRKA